MGLRVVVAADSAGYDYKEQLKKDLEADDRVDEVIDVGIGSGENTDYPHVAVAGARLIAAGKADRGLFVCGTGMGVAIAANKVPGIRARQLLRRTLGVVEQRPGSHFRAARHRARVGPPAREGVARLHLRPKFVVRTEGCRDRVVRIRRRRGRSRANQLRLSCLHSLHHF